MGTIDYYEPDPELTGLRCRRILNGWQGKDAENALFIWKQGVRHPTMQCVDENLRLSAEELTQFVYSKPPAD